MSETWINCLHPQVLHVGRGGLCLYLCFWCWCWTLGAWTTLTTLTALTTLRAWSTFWTFRTWSTLTLYVAFGLVD